MKVMRRREEHLNFTLREKPGLSYLYSAESGYCQAPVTNTPHLTGQTHSFLSCFFTRVAGSLFGFALSVGLS